MSTQNQFTQNAESMTNNQENQKVTMDNPDFVWSKKKIDHTPAIIAAAIAVVDYHVSIHLGPVVILLVFWYLSYIVSRFIDTVVETIPGDKIRMILVLAGSAVMVSLWIVGAYATIMNLSQQQLEILKPISDFLFDWFWFFV
jgi:hypothetical protein